MKKTNFKWRRFRYFWNKIDSAVYFLLLLVLVFVLWQTGALHAMLGQTYSQLPFPFDKTFSTTNALTQVTTTTTSIGIFNYAVANFGTMMYNAGITLSALIPGYLLGALLGYGCALLATVCRKWGGGVLVILTILVSAPVVALAPAINNMFGSSAPYAAKLVIVIITCMAGMAVNAYKGLNTVKPFSCDLMKVYNASSATSFVKMRLPASLPNTFTALKINVATAMAAVFISEIYAYTTSIGLGKVFKTAFDTQNRTAAWAYIFMAVVIGLIMYAIVAVIEKRAIRWHASQRKS